MSRADGRSSSRRRARICCARWCIPSPRPVRRRPGHLRRAPRPDQRPSGPRCRARLAAVPHPLRRQPDGRHTQERVGLVRALLHSVYDQSDAASVHAQSTGCSRPWTASCPPWPRTWTPTAQTSPLHQLPPRRSGADLVQQPSGTAQPGTRAGLGSQQDYLAVPARSADRGAVNLQSPDQHQPRSVSPGGPPAACAAPGPAGGGAPGIPSYRRF